MKLRIAKKILGLRKEYRAMFNQGKGWRIDDYRWRTIHEAHQRILRTERRHGFPSKWS